MRGPCNSSGGGSRRLLSCGSALAAACAGGFLLWRFGAPTGVAVRDVTCSVQHASCRVALPVDEAVVHAHARQGPWIGPCACRLAPCALLCWCTVYVYVYRSDGRSACHSSVQIWGWVRPVMLPRCQLSPRHLSSGSRCEEPSCQWCASHSSLVWAVCCAAAGLRL